MSISKASFPSQLKIARVSPTFKANSRDEFSNYRPISVLPAFSKIIEKACLNQLLIYLRQNNVIHDSQRGFISDKSTTTAVLTLSDHILKSFDKQQYTLGIFLDLAKAFETVDHKILISKLYYYGIRGSALRWFEDYLTNRKQFVTYNKIKSSTMSLTYSVPQGSLLAPILFNLYINDIKHSIKSLQNILYTDNSCFYLSDSNLDTLINTLIKT